MTWTGKMSGKIAQRIKTDDTPYTVGQLAHGIELFLLNALNLFIILLVSAALGLLVEVVPLLCSLFILRTLTGGVHLKNPWSCLGATLLLLLVGGAIIKYVPMPSPPALSLLTLITAGAGALINYLYGPAKHTYMPDNPAIQKRHRKIAILLITVGCILSLLLVEYSYKHSMTYILAVFYQSLFLTPASFRLVSVLEKTFSRG
ncbi:MULTISPECIES: accessory gene regulator ArgB-like protein [Brevibacillus]|jgi:Membrane protein putatively involved in post-translational modification of the autoinducing quorum-sensing peptide|uniref:accessory gene regulator ArgB-like protein n=1 Tax=Brevibacillus TaxID=55080 RepID=UPI000EE912EA|nr:MULTISPECIES: accessory gene regulator B family protein [Brevibacillus]MED2256218.1 accessory gene regulator B family protein [Brevibacillus parabrevis]NRQ53527.1 accessory gene regulator B family protein [Brevibacillus sp. HD1.4A]UED68621.1 accessory gene regulator B family protein [Brevibacillus sp. HD3.3A]HBZ81700.1 accessory regulator AgrB [Brevibacillus sp.]